MAAKTNSRFIYWGTILMALAFIVGGLTTFYLGYHTRTHTVEDLRNENLVVQDPRILLTYETGRAPEGVDVPMVTIDTAELADAQARVIRVHTLIATGGKTYSEMDREDPNRALYITSLTLQDSLHMAHSALELSLFVMGVGVAFTGTGLGIAFLGLPIVRKVFAI
jgi:hypothetical protein